MVSPRDRAMRRVSWNLANCHATVQKLLVRQVLKKYKLWSWRVTVSRCVINMCTQPWRDWVASIVLSGPSAIAELLVGNISYDEARRTCNILPLAERRHELGKRFFQRIIKDKSNVLVYLLPAKRNVQLTTRLRCARQYPTICARTNRYKKLLFYLD